MDRDALVQRMADAIFRSFNPWMSTGLANEPSGVQEMYRIHARAALAIAEPAIREDEREAVAAYVDSIDGTKQTFLDDIAIAIRARKEPRT